MVDAQQVWQQAATRLHPGNRGNLLTQLTQLKTRLQAKSDHDTAEGSLF